MRALPVGLSKLANGLAMFVCAVVAALMFAPRPEGAVGLLDVSGLPLINASLNALTGVLLLSGFGAIRLGNVLVHRALMTSAMASSVAFLASYVTYHLFSPGPTHYQGQWRALYFAILITHIVLAAVILPFAMHTWIRGFTGQIPAHKRMAPRTLAAWLYVSASGVAIYVMLYL